MVKFVLTDQSMRGRDISLHFSLLYSMQILLSTDESKLEVSLKGFLRDVCNARASSSEWIGSEIRQQFVNRALFSRGLLQSKLRGGYEATMGRKRRNSAQSTKSQNNNFQSVPGRSHSDKRRPEARFSSTDSDESSDETTPVLF